MTSFQLNLRIVSWIESGRLAAALIGEGDYFLKDHTWRNQHDRLLLINVLFQWAKTGDLFKRASEALSDALDSLDVDSQKEIIRDTLTAYRICSKDTGVFLNIDFDTRWNVIDGGKDEDEQGVHPTRHR